MTAPAHFDDDGQLRSTRFDDVYFSGDGVQQAEHVFVGGNDLRERFASACGTFVIGELGFGTGMNFLVTLRAFLEHAHPDARLVYVSCEQTPLGEDVLERVHAQLPDALAEAARAVRRALAEGSDRARFAGGRVTLNLLFGDARTVLPARTFAADAWYLDGFAPRVNPELWSADLMAAVAARTRPHGTAATYTVASDARQALQQAGFELHRRPGFGDKREMLHARRTAGQAAVLAPASAPKTVHVLGAGIAGTAAARAFAERGCTVTVVAPNGVADGASGIPAAAVRPRLWRPGPHAVPDAEIVAEAFRWTSRWLREATPQHFRACGVLLCAVDEDDERKVRERAENPRTADLVQWCPRDAASEHAGVPLPFGAAWIPTGGVVALDGAAHHLLDDPRIEVVPTAPTATADLVVHASARIPDGEIVRGQAIAVRAREPAPRTVVCTTGYLCPPSADGLTWLGSTYDRHDDRIDERPDDDARVFGKFDALPSVAAALRGAATERRFVGVRATTAQRVARIGLPEPGQGVSLAHGSRGAVTGPWAGELLAAAAFGEAIPTTPAHWSRLQARAATD